MTRRRYDVFVSYKSEDVHLVRRVAEILLANGIAVWFAEYQVLLKNFDKFQEAIDTGTSISRYGLCFTNDRYAESAYCQREIEQLLDSQDCGPDNIIEIMVPDEPRTHKRYPALSRANSLEHRSIDETVAYIGRRMQRPIVSAGAQNGPAMGA